MKGVKTMANMKMRIEALWSKMYNEYKSTYDYIYKTGHINNNPLWYSTANEVASCYEDYTKHDGKLKECREETQHMYTNLGNYIRRQDKLAKEESMYKVLEMCRDTINIAFQDLGLEMNSNNRISFAKSNKLMNYLFDNIIKPRFEELGIKGIKLKNKSRITPNAYDLFDITNIEFTKNDKVE